MVKDTSPEYAVLEIEDDEIDRQIAQIEARRDAAVARANQQIVRLERIRTAGHAGTLRIRL